MTDPFGAIFERQYETAVRVARGVLNDHALAEDVASETMLRVAKRLSQGRDPEAVEALVPIIAYGIAVDEYRSGEIPAGLGRGGDWLGELIAGRVLEIDQARFATAFDAGVRGLSEDDFTALTLTDLRGLPERDAADLLNVPRSTVNFRRARARRALREEIAA